ncbi:hypothetical protein C8F04DRAFT_1176805 [Mycena alexandri]|uniref:Secreted protein n=1 Tax=Mycena alexandri TaxID=1745969 RepID=A0AAD6TD15_9AGAR|nr:hypothetical protein C8F04DRAFT_1176805 [Mycena alexandri]
MVKNGLPTCIFLMLQGLFCTQFRTLWAVMVKNGLLVTSPWPAKTVFDGQEQPTGSHLPHGARNEHFKPTAIMLSSNGHNMLKPHLPFELLSSATQHLLLFAVDGSVPLQVAEGGNRARSLLPPPAVRQMVV